MSHFQLTEEQENQIHEVRLLYRMVVDLSCAIPPGKTVQLDPEGLIALLSVAENKLPRTEQLQFVAHH